ncbi:hypothetical protein HKBW3S42_02493 [Candidatus Hakubella thermalkaliphila]|uniref:Uncharacterized protein n=1 Tax=Candidatus Hakubella thermalkaliphila TaxID=2754717 RepID=A0A6V8PPR6_9ACTN|nr:hypothetical protein HKBW3S42_02493 [Candidatus Hakubella thermalkaliphila]
MKKIRDRGYLALLRRAYVYLFLLLVLPLPFFMVNSLYLRRAGLYLVRGEYDKALSDYSQAIRVDPSNEGLYLTRANFYVQRKSYDLAMSNYDKAIQLNPKYYEA